MEYLERADTARDLMLHFAGATGLWPARDEPRRYLWTDAFAVCNFLSLYRHYDEQRSLDLSLSLVEQVHTTLGRHRADDIRSGWISGLGEVDGAQDCRFCDPQVLCKLLPQTGESSRKAAKFEEWKRQPSLMRLIGAFFARCRPMAGRPTTCWPRW